MPTYRFINNDTGEEFDDFISNSRREDLLNKNPHITQVPVPFGIVSSTGTIDGKIDTGWKEVLQKIGEKHPNSELAERYNTRSNTEIKVQNVAKKVAKRITGKWTNG